MGVVVRPGWRRPDRNALCARLRRELPAHLDTALTDDAARVFVPTHTGRLPWPRRTGEVARSAVMVRLGAPGALAATKEMVWAERPAAMAA